MSTSDSDYSIDWLASDEEDSDTSSTTTTTITSLTQYPTSPSESTTATTIIPSSSTDTDCTFKDAPTARPKRKRGSPGECGSTSDMSRGQGQCQGQGKGQCTCMGHDHTASWPLGAMSGRPRQTPRRAAHGPVFVGQRETPQESKDTENTLFSHKRFLSTLLQIEKMLQSWFPHVKPRPSVIQSERSTPAKRQKRHHTSATLPLSSGPSLSTSPPSSRASSGPYSATILKWLHTSPICSPKTAGQGQPTTTTTTTTTPPSGCEPGATQDSIVSSSTDVSTRGRRSSHRRHGRLLAPPLAPPFKLRSPCLERLLQAKGSVMSRRMAQEEEEEEEEEPGSRRQAICTPPDSKHGQRQRSL
ncbi:hypothetical protein CRUP_034365 [Coryphaenoides rupestris]|nr:hypothetical protein CRUP_034365 [Coryphaenoides rupestris]